MGYQLNRPDLRREVSLIHIDFHYQFYFQQNVNTPQMEAECNAVAMGRKTKEEIMEPILIKMRECFERASAEAMKLDDAIARHFTRMGSNNTNSNIVQANFSRCGTCQGSLTLKELTGANNNARENRRNARSNPKLLHCSTCSLGFRLPSKGIPIALTQAEQNEQPHLCPICQFQVIKISQGEGYTGNGYFVCPKCWNDAPIEYGGAATSGEFRCFNCTHPTCSIATGTKDGDVEIFPCPFCRGGKITLRKTSRGHILSCSNSGNTATGRNRCDYKIWLPKAASSITIADSQQNGSDSNTSTNPIVCNQCSNGNKVVKKLSFRWNPNKVPPGVPTHQVACVLCDQGLKSDFQISIPQINQVRIHDRQQDQRRQHQQQQYTSQQPPSSSSSSTTTNVSTSWSGNSSGRGQGGRGGRGGGRGSYRNNYNGSSSSRSTSRSRERVFPNNNNNNNNNHNNNYNSGRSSSNTNNSSNNFHCYKCGQVGHFANACPN